MLNLFLLDTFSPTVFPAKTCLLNLYVSSTDFEYSLVLYKQGIAIFQKLYVYGIGYGLQRGLVVT